MRPLALKNVIQSMTFHQQFPRLSTNFALNQLTCPKDPRATSILNSLVSAIELWILLILIFILIWFALKKIEAVNYAKSLRYYNSPSKNYAIRSLYSIANVFLYSQDNFNLKRRSDKRRDWSVITCSWRVKTFKDCSLVNSDHLKDKFG